jgi:hypothetical protein
MRPGPVTKVGAVVDDAVAGAVVGVLVAVAADGPGSKQITADNTGFLDQSR